MLNMNNELCIDLFNIKIEMHAALSHSDCQIMQILLKRYKIILTQSPT